MAGKMAKINILAIALYINPIRDGPTVLYDIIFGFRVMKHHGCFRRFQAHHHSYTI